MRCPQCKKENNHTAKFCNQCGKLIFKFEFYPPIIRPKQIDFKSPVVAAFLGYFLTVFYTAYVLEQNWKKLGEFKKVNQVRYWFLGLMTLTLLLGYLITIQSTAQITDLVDLCIRLFSIINFWMVTIFFERQGTAQINYIKRKYGQNYNKQIWILTPIWLFVSVLYLYYFISTYIDL